MRCLFAVIVLALLPAGRASACSCRQVSAAEAGEAADAIFEGRVLEVVPEGNELRVRFEVVQYWENADSEHVDVITAANEAACGVAFAEATSWLVYARSEGGVLRTGICDRTRRIEDAEVDLELLQAGVVPVDIGPDDEVEPSAPRTEPSRAGCGSCAAGSASPTPAWSLLVLALVWLRRR